MTEVGICYTINNFLSEQLYTNKWSDFNPYPEHYDDRFKRQTLTYSFGNSFPIKEIIEHNIAGNITIYVHSPYEIPTIWSRSGLIVNENEFKTYNLKVFVRETNYDQELLSQTTPDVRRCRDITESNLKLFPSVYSRNLCLMECRAYFIWKLCDCIPHFYSHKYWKNYKVCNVRGLICFNKMFDIFRKINANTRSKFFKCGHCKTNCIDQIIVIKSLEIEKDISNNSTNKIHHIINDSPHHSYIRSAMYTHLDIIVGVSGILSTFLGFCVYSLCDLVYFFTIRIYWFRNGYQGSVGEIVF